MLKKIRKFQRRTSQVDATVASGDRVLEFPFSSEFPVERYFGMEILSHEKGAMKLDRLKAKAPLLFNHDRDLHLGVIEDAWIGDDKRGWCRVRFSESDLGEEKLRDIKAGILVNVSFGYEINTKGAKVLESTKNAELPDVLITDYMPFEISFVTIPADYTVGMGRSLDEEVDVAENEMPEDPVDDDDDAEERTEPTDPPDPAGEDKTGNEERALKITTVNERTSTVTKEELKKENERVMDIMSLGERHEAMELARKFAADTEKTAGDFALELVKLRGGTVQKITDKPIEMTEREKKQYSIARAINAVVNKDWKGAGFEQEISRELAKRAGKETEGFYMPTNIGMRAPYAAGASATGGALVQTDVLGSEFIDVLRARAVLVKAGARVLTGLSGNIAIPRKNGRSAYYWISENGTITESEATFDQVGFSPKTIAALSSVSKQLIQQSSMSVDALIADDLNKELGLGIDAAGLIGTGAGGQPKGIMNQSGIGSVPLGTNGAGLTLDALIDLETAVADANGDVETMSYITNARQIGVLKKAKTSGSGDYIWKADGKPMREGALAPINGYDIFRTNQAPRNLTKGSGTNLSAVFFGDWSQLVIAQWGAGIEILVNPYGDSYKKGGIDIRAMSMVDVNIRQAASFAAITDAL